MDTATMPRRLPIVRENRPGSPQLFVDFRLLELRSCETAQPVHSFSGLDDMLCWLAMYATYEEFDTVE